MSGGKEGRGFFGFGGKHAKPEITSLEGNQAELANVEHRLMSTNPLTEEELMAITDPQLRGLIRGFQLAIEDAIKREDHSAALRAFNNALIVVTEREATNAAAFASVEQRTTALTRERTFFYQKAIQILGDKGWVNVKGEKRFSTREGGPRWAIKQAILVLVNQQSREVSVTKISKKKGHEVENTLQKISYRIDPTLWDEYIQVTPRGILFFSSVHGQDGILVPWKQAQQLLEFSPDATFLVDGLNRNIRPILGGKMAQSPWVPVGLVSIKDRQRQATLVRLMMRHPDDFAAKLQELIRVMAPEAVITDRVEAVAPVSIRDFLGSLSPATSEELRGLFEIARPSERRHAAAKLNRAPMFSGLRLNLNGAELQFLENVVIVQNGREISATELIEFMERTLAEAEEMRRKNRPEWRKKAEDLGKLVELFEESIDHKTAKSIIGSIRKKLQSLGK